MGSGASCRSGGKQARILMVGLDASGKTTFLYRRKLGEVVTTIPTIGFNVESIEHGKFTFTVWDVGGQDKIRPLWRHYADNTQGLIYFVDSADKERMDLARGELVRILGSLKSDVPIIVVANKQDLPGSLSGTEVGNRLGIHRFEANRDVHIQEACTVNGDGVFEVLNVMGKFIRKPRRKK